MQKEPEQTDTPHSLDPASIFISHGALADDDAAHARLEYHLKSGDYFNTVATIIGFLQDSLQNHCEENPQLEARELELAQALRKDLMYLNEHYRIEPKKSRTQ